MKNLQSEPMAFHAASTSGPASKRNTFSFLKEPLKRTVRILVSTSFKMGAIHQFEHSSVGIDISD
jgi:hypothetical protein